MALTLDSLMTMTPFVNGQDVVRLAARHVFLGQVKGQQPVRELFEMGTDSAENGVNQPTPLMSEYEAAAMTSWFDFNRYSVLYVAQAICKVRDPFGIHAMLDEQMVDEQLQQIHDSSDWKKIGFALYTSLFHDLVKDETTKVSFRNFTEKEPRKWALRMTEKLRDKTSIEAWLCSESAVLLPAEADEGDDVTVNVTPTQQQSPTISSKVLRDINIFFVKLHLLDPTAVLPAFQSLSQVIPNLNLDLATTNYLGGPLEWTLIREEVRAAVYTASYATNVAYPAITTGPLEYYSGVRVCEFIMLACRELGLWNGSYPDNRRVSQWTDRCLMM